MKHETAGASAGNESRDDSHFDCTLQSQNKKRKAIA